MRKSFQKFQPRASHTMAYAACFVGKQAVSLMQGFQMWGYTEALLINILLSTRKAPSVAPVENVTPAAFTSDFFDTHWAVLIVSIRQRD